MTISKSIFVKRSVDDAFRLFTAEIGRWWPLQEGFSFGGPRAHQLFLEGRVGGRFFERFRDGEELEVGRVTVYEPPARVAFSWRQPGWDAATEVEVRFVASAGGTRVLLEHRGWEALADAARASRKSYDGGWDLVLSRYAEQASRTPRAPSSEEGAPMIKLHVFPPSPRAAKVLALADHLAIPHERCLVDLFKGEQQRPEYAALNPNRRMPVLEDGDFVLWESNAILLYLAAQRPESGLWPADARGQADVTRWLNWESAHWTPACTPLAYERVVKKLAGRGEPDPAEVARGEQEFHRFAPVLDGHLRGRQWLLGDALTIAEFSVGSALAMSAAARYPLERYPELVRWYAGLASLPAWQKAMLPPMA